MKREGRLEEFNTRREELRAELKEKGVKRKDANHKAWQQAIAEFPPLPEPASEEEEETESSDVQPEFDEYAQPPPPPYDGCDIMWAFFRVDYVKTVKEEDAPNPGAWFLLKWARRDLRDFAHSILPKAYAAYEKREDAKQREAERTQFKHLSREELLQQFNRITVEYQAEREKRGLKMGELLNIDL